MCVYNKNKIHVHKNMRAGARLRLSNSMWRDAVWRGVDGDGGGGGDERWHRPTMPIKTGFSAIFWLNCFSDTEPIHSDPRNLNFMISHLSQFLNIHTSYVLIYWQLSYIPIYESRIIILNQFQFQFQWIFNWYGACHY